MNDYIVKALGFNKHVRIYASSCANTTNYIGDRLNYFPSALDAMGRVISVSVNESIAPTATAQSFSATVTVRFGYTTRTVTINGKVKLP